MDQYVYVVVQVNGLRVFIVLRVIVHCSLRFSSGLNIFKLEIQIFKLCTYMCVYITLYIFQNT